jgi:hypothetical protein
MSVDTIDDLAEMMRDSVENVQAQFDDPEDDWVPVMSLVPQEGQNVMLALDGRWLKNDSTKRRLVKNVMTPAVSGVGAKLVATVFSAYHVEVPKGMPVEEMIRPSEAEERDEVVMLTVMDSFNVKTWMAIVRRTADSPPELGNWEEIPANSTSGLFIEEIQEALRDSSGRTDEKFMEILEDQGHEI